MSSLLDRLPSRQRGLVSLAREIAASQHTHVFLVGGPLRDLLLGTKLTDLDLTLEHGTEAFAREFASRARAELRSFPQFLTFKVLLPGKEISIDIATTRKETYPEPGALPVVSPSSLREDMFRRDFTVNAMALDLQSEEAIDFFDGSADLSRRQLRVLHDQSFRDDPIRIYRGIRLAARLGFSIEPATRELMGQAIKKQHAASVSRERHWREFFLALAEPDRAVVLHELASMGALEILIGVTGSDAALLQRLQRAEQLFGDRIIDQAVVLLAILGGSPSRRSFDGSGLTGRQIHEVRTISQELPELVRRLRDASEKEQVTICREVSDELLVVAAASDPSLERPVRRYWEYASLELPVRGDELDVQPGPHIGRALEQTRAALFFGEITLEEAPAFARRAAQEYLEKTR